MACDIDGGGDDDDGVVRETSWRVRRACRSSAPADSRWRFGYRRGSSGDNERKDERWRSWPPWRSCRRTADRSESSRSRPSPAVACRQWLLDYGRRSAIAPQSIDLYIVIPLFDFSCLTIERFQIGVMSYSRCTTWPASSSRIVCSTPLSTTLYCVYDN